MPTAPETLIITRGDIARVMAPADFLIAADQAFRAAALGKASSPAPMHIPMRRGAFHAKGASIALDRDYVAVKVNGNFPGNPAQRGLPTIQGAIILSDGSNGALLAVLDSMEVTLWRTAAASALAAQHLARPDSRTLLVCGAGEQGRAHAIAMREVLPLERCVIWDCNHAAAETLASELAGSGSIAVSTVRGLEMASRSADVIACCTSATEPYLDVELVKPGTFIAAVGADSPAKSEIAPQLMAVSTVVTDVSRQCAEMGDLHHAIRAGCMSETDVHAELAEIFVGARPVRRSSEEIIIFDSTGTGLQDAAASAAIYERCAASTSVRSIAFGDA